VNFTRANFRERLGTVLAEMYADTIQRQLKKGRGMGTIKLKVNADNFVDILMACGEINASKVTPTIELSGLKIEVHLTGKISKGQMRLKYSRKK
jgi:hypothetical protein